MKNSILKRHPVKTIVLLLFLLLVFAEVALRVAFAVKNYPIGKLAPAWLAFKPMDSLAVWDAFYTDENGIYKARREYWHQPHWNINSDGFRGREFVAGSLNDSISVLLIGDSYTWGAHAKPPDSCFADLLNKEFICYNAGIPGTDPAQYLRVAETYIPKLHPDFTFVFLFLGNDLMDSLREIISHRNIYYQTNAGWLPVDYKGIHFSSAQESYRYVVDKFSPHSFFEKIILKTAIGTALLTLPLRMQEYSDWNKRKQSSVTNDYLLRIKSFCEQHRSKFLLFIIPREEDLKGRFYKNPEKFITEHYPALIKNLEKVTIVFPFRKEHLYPMPDGHLNNAGHRFAAEFIKSELKHRPSK